ncbi:MAG: DUF192 domain-containing protein [Planctomycetota bacterium]
MSKSSVIPALAIALVLIGCRAGPWVPPLPNKAPQVVHDDTPRRPQAQERITDDGTWLYRLPMASGTLWVEVAATPDQRRKGLMGRESLPSDQGMLFLYAEPDWRSFWMKSTYIPLDLAYLRSDGTIIEILALEPDDGSVRHPSSEPAHYVLETNAGWFEQHGVVAGQRVALPEGVLKLAPRD